MGWPLKVAPEHGHMISVGLPYEDIRNYAHSWDTRTYVVVLESQMIFLIGYFQKNFSEDFGKSGKYSREDDSRGETVVLR